MGPILSTSGCTRGNKDQENDLQSKKMSFADSWIKPSALRNATKQAICPQRSVGIYGQLFSSAFQPDCSTNGNLSLRGGQQTPALDVNYWQQPNCYTISDRKQSSLTKDHLCLCFFCCHVSSCVDAASFACCPSLLFNQLFYVPCEAVPCVISLHAFACLFLTYLMLKCSLTSYVRLFSKGVLKM